MKTTLDKAGRELVKRGKRLIARPTVPSEKRSTVDIAAEIEAERNRWPFKISLPRE